MDLATNMDGSPTPVEQAVSAEGKKLLAFIRRRVRTQEDAEDILQEVFYQLLANHSVAEPIEQLTAWLFTVARNKITDWYRKRRPEPLPAAAEDPSLPLNLEDILFDPAQHPDRIYARSLLWTALAESLEELPAEQREVFVRHELEGQSFKEIAAATGVPLNTLLSRKRYAVLFLRAQLQELYEEIQDL